MKDFIITCLQIIKSKKYKSFLISSIGTFMRDTAMLNNVFDTVMMNLLHRVNFKVLPPLIMYPVTPTKVEHWK